MTQSIVVIGAGQAGVQTAEALRAGGFAGAITLLGDEPYGPYHRPPLSKAWLAGEMDSAQLVMRAPDMLARKNISLRTGVSVSRIDRAAKQVYLADGSALPYTGLVLATGATPRSLALPGGNAAGVLALRSRDDADAIARHLAECVAQQQPVIVIGGGFIGLEVAATARKKGLQVTVLEAAPRLLGRVLAPVLSSWYAQLHRSHGVNLLLDTRIAALETGPQGRVSAVRMADGTLHPAGLVVVGIGVIANDQLAQAAGLDCERGIVVDACARTSDPAIVAAGDCTARRLPDGSLIRLESVNPSPPRPGSGATSTTKSCKWPACRWVPTNGRCAAISARLSEPTWAAASACITSRTLSCWRWTASTPAKTICKRASCLMPACHPHPRKWRIGALTWQACCFAKAKG